MLRSGCRVKRVPDRKALSTRRQQAGRRWSESVPDSLEEGDPISWGGSQDMRERKQGPAEQRENRFELVTWATQDAIFDWDLVAHEIWRNENYQRLFGAPETSPESDNWWLDRVHPEDLERVVALQNAVLRGEGEPSLARYRLLRPDGSYADVLERRLVVRNPQGQPVRMIGALNDVTELRRAEEAFKESETRFQAIFEDAAIGIALVDMQGHPVESNPALQRMLGYNETELAQMAFAELEHPDDVLASRDLFAELIEGKRDRYQLEKRFCRKDGQIVWGQLTVSVVRNQEAEPRYAIAMVEDISERKRAREALRVSEAKFRALSECAAGAIFICQGNRFLYSNPAMELVTGYSQDEILRMNFWEIAHPDAQDLVKERGLARQRGEPVPPHYELKIVTKTGEERWVDFSGARFELEGNSAVAGIAFDITERKRVEGKLRHLVGQLHALADRLQTVREEERTRLAREIHDELGQALMAIKLHLGSLFRELGEYAKPLGGASQSILSQVDQTMGTVRRIAGQLRPGILDNLGLPTAIEWAAEELHTRTGIKSHLDLPKEKIVLDQERTTALFRIFQEALTNVALHSRATEVRVRLYRQTAATILEVRDNGVGIQPHRLTGTVSLGILGMRERALVLGGHVEVTGRPGEGTNVSVSIPDPSPAVGE